MKNNTVRSIDVYVEPRFTDLSYTIKPVHYLKFHWFRIVNIDIHRNMIGCENNASIKLCIKILNMLTPIASLFTSTKQSVKQWRGYQL